MTISQKGANYTLRFWLVSSWPCVPLNVMIDGCIPVKHEKNLFFPQEKRADFIMFHPPIQSHSPWGMWLVTRRIILRSTYLLAFLVGDFDFIQAPFSEPVGSVGTHGDAEMAGAGSLTPKFQKTRSASRAINGVLMIHTNLPVVPHKAVAEVSKIGNL